VDTYVINLDRSVDRWAAFETRNSAARERVIRISAVDGSTIDRGALVERGLITDDLCYSDAALGNALSHLALWEKAVERDCPLTICEDDVVFNHNFFAATDALVGKLPPDWHAVYWGWNFDSILAFELINGVSPCVGEFNERELRSGIAIFQSADVNPQMFRLMRAFGTVCYSVSPAGARLLRQLCIPLRNMEIPIRALDRTLQNCTLDVMINAFFRRIKAFVSFPPLAVTPNDHEISTVERPSGEPD
jgi:GR25 family glycosyltransferase involved in LPS biosynthesis